MGNLGGKHSFHKNSWSPLDVPSPVPGTGDTAGKGRARLPDAGRTSFHSPTAGPPTAGSPFLPVCHGSQPSLRAGSCAFSASFPRPSFKNRVQSSKPAWSPKCALPPHRKCQPTQHGQPFVFSVPSGPGLSLQHFWQVLVVAAPNSEHLAAGNESVAIWKG